MFTFFRQLLFVMLLWQLLPAAGAFAQSNAQDRESGEASSAEVDNEDRRVNRLGDEASEEWQPGLRVSASPAGNQPQNGDLALPDPEQNAQLEALLSRLAARPGNRQAMSDLDSLLGNVLEQANQRGSEGDLDGMRQLLIVVQNVNPRISGLASAFSRLEALEKVNGWLANARDAIKRDALIAPEGDSALDWAHKVLAVNSQDPEALAILLDIQELLVGRALSMARELDFESAEEWLYEASLVADPQILIEEATIEIAEYRITQARQIERKVFEAIEDEEFDLADFMLIDLIALAGNTPRAAELREKLRTARIYGQYKPGQVIQDPLINGRGSAPAIVIIPPGSFLMGSGSEEEGRSENEGPQHRVTFSTGFAMGLQEVTVGQFRSFIGDSKYRTDAEKQKKSRVYDEKTGRIAPSSGIHWVHDYQGNRAHDNDPVLHVTWRDASAFVEWLSEATGKSYRLPSEAEFEYVLRAGTVTRFWWGDVRPEAAVENLTGELDASPNGRAWTTNFRRYGDGFWGPAPGASFAPNPWGLHDLAGNVSEWVEDCWHQTYVRAPDDGSAWVNPGCSRKVIRGGYWASAPDQSRSAARLSGIESLSGPRVGFRIARDL